MKELTLKELAEIRLECLRLAVTLAVTNKQTKKEDIDFFAVTKDMVDLVVER
jgi:hypothetical protein